MISLNHDSSYMITPETQRALMKVWNLQQFFHCLTRRIPDILAQIVRRSLSESLSSSSLNSAHTLNWVLLSFLPERCSPRPATLHPLAQHLLSPSCALARASVLLTPGGTLLPPLLKQVSPSQSFHRKFSLFDQIGNVLPSSLSLVTSYPSQSPGPKSHLQLLCLHQPLLV